MDTFPCGKCLNCLKKRISGWSFRLMMEEKRSSSAYFITFTYDTDSVPISKNGFMELRKSDVQRFFKRLRKNHDYDNGCDSIRGKDTQSIRYFAVGEYGGNTRRPHYHAIIYNADLSKLIGERDAKFVKMGKLLLDGERPYYCDAWTKKEKGKPRKYIGHITVGKVSEASVGYTLKYMQKPAWRPMHRNDDRTPQFSLMSKRLGSNYLNEAMIKWHMEDVNERMYCNLKGGQKIGMPRYYKDKIYGATNIVDRETGEVIPNPLRQQLNQYNKLKVEKKELEQKQKEGNKYYRNRLEKAEALDKRLINESSKRNKL